MGLDKQANALAEPIGLDKQANTVAETLRSKLPRYRIDIIEMLAEAGSGHPGGSLSAIDIVSHAVPLQDAPPARSSPTGRSATASCSARGTACPRSTWCWPTSATSRASELWTLRKLGSPLQGHPCHQPGCPAIEASTGSLGQGLCVAQGMALAARLDGSAPPRLLPAGRRRDAGGPGLGGGHVGAQVQARQPDRAPRLQQGADRRLRAGRDGPRAARRQVARLRLARADASTATTSPQILDALDRGRAGARAADATSSPHHQGQGGLVHGGRGRLARRGADAGRRPTGPSPRSNAGRHAGRGGGPMTAKPAATRDAFGETLLRLGAEDTAHRRARRRPQRVDALAPVRQGLPGALLPDGHPGGEHDRHRRGAGPLAARSPSAAPSPASSPAASTRSRSRSPTTTRGSASSARTPAAASAPTATRQMALEDMALLRSLPNMAVLQPGRRPRDASAASSTWSASPRPGLPAPDAAEGAARAPRGLPLRASASWTCCARASDLAICATGATVHGALAAAARARAARASRRRGQRPHPQAARRRAPGGAWRAPAGAC